MRTSKHFLIGLISIVFVSGLIGLVLTPPSQAEVEFGGIKKILKQIFPPCGPRTRKQRFVVSKDGTSVCDNKTGLYWEQSPSTDRVTWADAIQHCENLTLGGKTWRLPTLQEMQWDSLIDYSESDQATPLNTPNGPFQNVLPGFYWSASEVAGRPTDAWFVDFVNGGVLINLKDDGSLQMWCVSGGQNVH
jgi:hypothetical protein